MMKSNLLIIFYLIISFNTICEEIDYSKLLVIIEQEEKMLSSSRRNNITLKYRLFELMSEKLKIVKHFENISFIKAKQKNTSLERKAFFKKTTSLYQTTRKTGEKLLRQSPDSIYAANIYMTMAQNSKDYAYDDLTSRYLTKAIKKSKTHSPIWYMSMVMLAETYYNNKEYSKASTLYSKVMYNNKDEWFTKNLFNYGWCLFKTHKFDKAIDLLEKAYVLSKSKDYIDLRDQLTSSMAVFYTLGKEVKRGISFIQKENDAPFEAFFNLLKQASNKGLYEESTIVINILKSIPEFKDLKNIISLNLFLFDHYKQYKKDNLLYEVASILPTLKLDSISTEEATYKLKDQVKSYQIMLKASYKKHDNERIEMMLGRTLDFFRFLSSIDKQNKAEYDYYSGESLFSVERYEPSIVFYKNVLDATDSEASKKFHPKSMDALYAAIANSALKETKEKELLEYAYLKNINLYPQDEKTTPIYTKLFNLYLSQSSDAKMMSTLALLLKNMPKLKEEYLRLFKISIDFAIERKDTYLLATKIQFLKDKKINLTSAQLSNLELTLSTILFNQNQIFEKNKDFSSAIAGYNAIFFNMSYPASTRQKSALKLAIIYNDTLEDSQVLKWITKSNELQSKTKINLKSEYHLIAQKMALKQNFTSAANINRFIIQENCNDKKENEKLYLEAISFDLTNNYLRKALYTYEKAEKCVDSLLAAQSKFIDYLFLNEKIDDYISFINKKNLFTELNPTIDEQLQELFWKYQSIAEAQSQIRSLEKTLLKRGIEKPVSLNRSYLVWNKTVQTFSNSPIIIGEIFDPEKFNTELNARFEKMSLLIKEGDQYLQSKNINIILNTYNTFESLLFKLEKEIKSFNPTGLEKEFLTGFKKQMLSIATNIESQKNNYRKIVVDLKHKNKYLSPSYISALKSREYLTYDL